ncbi:MAG: MBL fold metallo-hydrolase [Ruminococcaceae bacterium]|nr:MBL fold metallo-hydrolase [Oscillospiraceae bacterium]
MKLFTLGTSHGATEIGRVCSGNLVEVNGAYYLFDCGGSVEAKMTNHQLPIGEIKAVFISHMHEDHAGTLSSIAKRFIVYLNREKSVKMYLPEQNGIDAFQNWLKALHLTPDEKIVSFFEVQAGEIYRDENITVTAIPTAHLGGGKFPSFAYVIEAQGKKLLYTGDLALDFHDYPEILFKEEFDTVLSELVHFDFEKNFETILKTKTKRLIFTHMSLTKAEQVKEREAEFPFEVIIAEDDMCFEI